MSYEIELKPRKKRRWPIVAIVLGLIVVAAGLAYVAVDRGYFVFNESRVTGHESRLYICPMHPTYTSDRPGECPICGMNLVLAEEEEADKEVTKKDEATLYICPMHPTYTSDRPGECPICGMNLVPADDEEVEAEPKGAHEKHFKEPPGRAALKVTQTQRQMIGVKTAAVAIKDITKEIRTVATVAYDPKLAVAQREYLTARRLGDRQLTRAAEERLVLMGMSKEQVRGIAKSGRIQKNLYLISPSGKAWIYGMIYEVDIPYVNVGDPVEVTIPTMPDKRFEGTIAAMDPIVDQKTRTITVRSEVSNPEGLLKPNLYVNMHLAKPLGELMVIPRSALLWSDQARYVFVDKGKGRLVPREVTIGKQTDDYVQITSGLAEGEKVVVSPDFLIDAESQLKATIKKMREKGMKKDETPGGHVH